MGWILRFPTSIGRLARALNPGRACLLPLALAAAGCTHRIEPLQRPPEAVAVTTHGLNVSMIYLARVGAGVIVIDLGWWGAERALEDGLDRLGAEPGEVVAVFLTHSHRDHIGAWRRVRHAPFHLPLPEVERLLGRTAFGGWLPRLTERLLPSRRPREGEVAVAPFSRDTVFAFGADTLRAFHLPGHTAGSAAYLFRGVLFVGDALARPPLVGFRATPGLFADDAALAARSLDSLWERVAPFRVEHVCTAHAKCSPFTPGFRRRVGGRARPDAGRPPSPVHPPDHPANMVQSKATTVQEYLDALPEERREVVSRVREVILRNLPDGYREGMNWGMISYEIPLESYPETYNGQPLGYAALAAQKNHYALYLMGAYSDPAEAERLKEGFERAGKKLDMGKSCLRFRRLDDLPLEVVAEVIAGTPPEEMIARYEAARRR